jgi:hypothetical protein
MTSLRARLIALIAICAVALAAAIGYLTHSAANQRATASKAPQVAQTSLTALQNKPRIVFRNTSLGDQNGLVAEVALDDPKGPRAITNLECDRVYAAARKLLCLASQRGVVTKYSARVLDDKTLDEKSAEKLPLTGVPSRARLSGDARLAATTSFTAGDSYGASSFSTRTVISQIDASATSNLEDFTLVDNGKSIRPVDRNYWGVTFASDNRTFFATAQFAKHTYLVRGDLAAKTLITLHQDAECPSLSPDGKTIVFKQRGSLAPGKWRLVRYDLASGAVTPLAETRSVDDQVEWLDNNTVIYGVPRAGTQAAIDDVWSTPADGSGAPALVIEQAWSPAVVR